MRVVIHRSLRRRNGKWLAFRDQHTPYGDWIMGHAFAGTFAHALWFMLTGKDRTLLPPFWTFRIDGGMIYKTRWSDEVGSCSAGLYSRWLYFELLQGVDICDLTFYRWLRIGIPNHGAWRLRLQKRPA